MPKTPKVIAILVSDIHLSNKAPIARSAEPCWYSAMRRQLEELTAVQGQYGAEDCPVIIAGDLMDRWSCPPELITFALANLPDNIWAIPGQHDLPNHNYAEIERSAFWTLKEAGKLKTFSPAAWCGPEDHETVGPIMVHTYPWGFPIEPCPVVKSGGPHIQLAICHSYIWSSKANSYPSAPKEQKVGKLRDRLEGYDLAHFGDNHKTVIADRVFNPGSFYRRKIDEKEHCPIIGILRSDGSVEPYEMDVSKDLWIDVDAALEMLEAGHEGIEEFVANLKQLGDTGLNFVETVKRYMEGNKLAGKTKDIIVQALEKCK